MKANNSPKKDSNMNTESSLMILATRTLRSIFSSVRSNRLDFGGGGGGGDWGIKGPPGGILILGLLSAGITVPESNAALVALVVTSVAASGNWTGWAG